MILNTAHFEKLKSLLDQQYTWPALYTFKFIIPKDELPIAQQIFPTEELVFKNSKNGKYISLTLTRQMASSNAVIDYYKKATLIPGVISL
jgi:hypothetical protein